ncbi:sugar ABC transporter substrate-binding protein [Paenibacillus aurantius]|uniref:Sugar ABC transporter substrate-binding protein n=1 Tax=Paenibacillus aurantius TaxID=2918900 RepID=A0AA96RHD9_9BACL|nr:sugar ABC transporter substrate-binding protein [Paenibacillus aurantius]WNQ13258.1 sugar ABC transporter substrate-binding protein [Paenibacillus aurantius]
MKRKMFLGMSMVLIAGMVTACSSQSNGSGAGSSSAPGSSAASSPKAENVELTWWTDSNADMQDIYKQYKADFEKANPNVKINIVAQPDDKIQERISIAVNTNALPDIQEGSIGWPLTYAKKGLLVPLDEIIQKNDFDPGVLNSLAVDKKSYMYPFNFTASAMMVNRDLFKAKNAENLLPKDMGTWTYDQFKEAAKAVNEPSKQIYGFGTYAGDIGGDQGHHMFLWGFGAKTWADDNMTAVLNSPQGAEGLEYLIKMVEEGLTPPGTAGLKAGQVINEMFLQGKVAMTFGSIGNFSAFNKAWNEGSAKKFDVDLVPYPSKDGKSSNTVLFGSSYWVWNTKNEAKIKWSKEFVKFVNTKENMSKLTKLPSIIVPLKSLAGSYDANSAQGKTLKLFQYAGNIGVAIPGYSETRAAFTPELQAAFTRKKTPQQALDAWVTKANEIVKNASK